MELGPPCRHCIGTRCGGLGGEWVAWGRSETHCRSSLCG